MPGLFDAIATAHWRLTIILSATAVVVVLCLGAVWLLLRPASPRTSE